MTKSRHDDDEATTSHRHLASGVAGGRAGGADCPTARVSGPISKQFLKFSKMFLKFPKISSNFLKFLKFPKISSNFLKFLLSFPNFREKEKYVLTFKKKYNFNRIS